MNTASGRGSRKRVNARTIGFSRIAISAATTKMNTAWLTARDQLPERRSPASGRPTSCTQRGTTNFRSASPAHRANLAAAPVAERSTSKLPGSRVPWRL